MITDVFFDWAGTLADDVELTLAATNETLRHFGGEPVDLATYRAEFTIPIDTFYNRRTPHAHTIRDLDEVFFAAYRQTAGSLRLFDGIRELLLVAHRRGLRLNVLSTVSTDIIRESLQRLGIANLFTSVYGGVTDKVEFFPQLVTQLGLVRDKVLFAGDSPHDLDAAAAARVRGGAALYGYSPSERLLARNPDYAYRSVDDFASQLDRDYLLRSTPLVIATVGGFILAPDGKFLVVRTRKWSNTFGIPGGKIHYGETMQAAFEREILEETGLEVRGTRFLMIQDCIESPEFLEKRHFLLINYVTWTDDPARLKHNYEIEECRWVNLNEARALTLNQPTKLALEEALRLGLIKEQN